jgi:hypothetical protein
MHYCTTIFGQLLAFIPKGELKRLTGQHQAERYVKKLTVWNHLVVLLYAQATNKDSLREIEAGLRSCPEIWHHLGIKTVAKSSLARVNNTRDPIVFEKVFYALLKQCLEIIPKKSFSFDNPLYSLDATVINLCLSLFNWAKYRHNKGAMKLHFLLDNKTGLPMVLNLTKGKIADISQGRKMKMDIPSQSILVFDRGYLDYSWWRKLDRQGIFFVTRIKENAIIIVSERLPVLHPKILADEHIWIGDPVSPPYDKELRRVTYLDEKKKYIFLTNNFELKAEEIAFIYKERWQIELFFKWIKQNLKVKTFLGTSKNAVMNQIWASMIYYLLLSYIKFQTRSRKSLLELTWMIKETLILRRSLLDILSLTPKTVEKLTNIEPMQGELF